MNHLKTVIAEDEPLARARLQRLISSQTNIELVASAENGDQALELIHQYQPDLVILDINMPVKTGLEVAQEIQESLVRPPAIIFTTAYDQYALDAFKVNASGYLMKPILEDDLFLAIEVASKLSRLQVNNLEGLSTDAVINIKRSATIESVPVGKISHFKAQEKMVVAYMESGSESVVNFTLKQLESKLAPAFNRIHRHTLINTQFIEKLFRDDDGHYFVALKGYEAPFSVSRRQVSTLKKMLSG